MLPLVLGSYFIGAATALSFNLSHFNGEFDDDAGVLKSLVPTIDTGFDFSILDVFDSRNGDGNFHTGDINLRYRRGGQSSWTAVSTSTNRSNPGAQLANTGNAISTWDISAVFASSGLNVTRTWSQHEGNLVLQLDLTNTLPSETVEVGGLGFPLEVNNVLTNRAPADALQECSFIDPYVGLFSGYAQVRRLSGLGPNMVIIPFTAATSFEAWNFLTEDYGSLGYQSTSYEGNYEWLVHTAAFADDEWAGVEPWNEPTSLVLEPGKSASYGLLFSVVSSVTDIESAVASLGIPVAVGVPGYVLLKGTTGSLYLNSSLDVSAIEVYPTDALTISNITNVPSAPWIGYSVNASNDHFGRARVTVTWSNNTKQTIHYWVSDSTTTAVEKLGEFIAANQWFTNTSDPFGRAPSIISYDQQTNDFVLQDNRVWIAGLADDGGSGSFVAFALKQVFQPVADQIHLLETFVNETYWGRIQLSSGDDKYGVRKSLFYYDPSIDWQYSTEFDWAGAWNETEANSIARAYNYVWGSILYWSLYAAEQVVPGVLTVREPRWYLSQAYETVNFVLSNDKVDYVDVGLMGESMWGNIIQSLYYENMTSEALTLESLLKGRQVYWSKQDDPFGSEQPWDCTGQEGVYYWSQYFNDSTTALKTIESIRGLDPIAAHWAWNGNARRYWDFTTAGNPNTSRIERQVHHYGSSLNAIPLLDHYRRSNDPQSLHSLYDLRLGYAGHMASLSNINEDGFGSMAFHSYADTLSWDTYTGDYGPNWVGHYQSSASYLVKHPDFGWVAFGGNVQDTPSSSSSSSSAGNVTVTPLDSLRRRLFVAPVGLYVVFETGRVQSYTWSEDESTLQVVVGPDGDSEQTVVFSFEQTSAVVPSGAVLLTTSGVKEAGNGEYLVDVPKGSSVSLQWSVKGSSS